MEIVNTLDIDGTQWEMQDNKARNRIEEVAIENSKIIDIQLGGTFIFTAKMKCLGKDEMYEYYTFWWGPQNRSSAEVIKIISVIPPNTNTDKILSLNLNILQDGNTGIDQRTQHYDGPNQSGLLTYIYGAQAAEGWTISGMGILRRTK